MLRNEQSAGIKPGSKHTRQHDSRWQVQGISGLASIRGCEELESGTPGRGGEACCSELPEKALEAGGGGCPASLPELKSHLPVDYWTKNFSSHGVLTFNVLVETLGQSGRE